MLGNDCFIFLHITTEDGYTVVKHVTDEYDEYDVFVEEANCYGLPYNNWKHVNTLIDWVKQNQPNWKILYKKIPYEALLNL